MAKVVQGTNDSSITSKYSMILAGYDKDPYMKYFVPKKHKRTPLINLVYYVRWIAMSRLVNHFCMNTHDLHVQIVSLGAGFDTTYFRIVSGYNNFRYFEIDLPGVVKKKVEIIKNCNELLDEIAVNKENITFGSENEYLFSHKYTLFSHDLSTLEGLEIKLKSFGFEFSAPTLVFSECALTYLEEEKCTALIRWIQRRFTRSVFATYEQINPDDAFGRVMTAHFKKNQTPLKSIHTYKTVQLQIQRFLSCGWYWCKGTISNRLLEKDDDEIIPTLWEKIDKEPFDEFEEWQLSNFHYALIVATTQEYQDLWDEWLPSFLYVPDDKLGNNMFALFNSLSILENHFTKGNIDPPVKWNKMSDISVERFGHSYLSVNDDRFLIIGGFGNQDKKHARVNTVHHVSIADSTITPIQILNHQNKIETPRWDCMYSTCTKVSDNYFVLYGGRTSPTNAVNSKPLLCKFHWCEETKSGCIIPIVQGSLDSVVEPCPRWRHSAVAISPGNVVIYGGLTEYNNNPRRVLNDAWLLKVTNIDKEPKLTWSPLPSLTFHNIFSHSATAHEGTMYISGGFQPYLNPTFRIFTFRLIEGWEEIKTVPQLRPRYSHTSHVTENNQLLLLGGVNSFPFDQPGLAIICLKNYNVIEYNLMPSSPEYPVLMLHNHISIYRKKDNSVYIVGGGGNCFSFGTYFNPNLVRLCITTIEFDNLARKLYEMSDGLMKFKGRRYNIKTYKEVLMKNPRFS